MRLRISGWIGALLNWLGFPGFVRECKYKSTETDTFVSVRYSSLYSVVSVNGVDVYFHRITGEIDGVGVSQAEHCTALDTLELTHLAEPRATTP